MRTMSSPVRTWCVATLVLALAFTTPALAWKRAQPAALGASAALVDFYKLFVAGECDLLGKMLPMTSSTPSRDRRAFPRNTSPSRRS